MDSKYDLSIVVPCYNESSILKDSVSELVRFVDQTIYSYEIIFVDDKSSDGTQKLIEQIASGKDNMKWLFHSENIGRGGAVIDGIKIANGDIVGFIDIDLEVHPRYIIPMVIAIKEEGFDMATANRIYRPNLIGMSRDIASLSYHWFVKFLIKLPLEDTETGFKFFRRKKILPLLDKTKSKGWFWDTEICYFAHVHNMKIKEIPCLFIRRHDKKSSVNFIHDSIDYFINLCSFKRNLK